MLRRWLEVVGETELTFGTGPWPGANENLQAHSLTAADAGQANPDELAEFILAVAQVRRQQAASVRQRPLTFYAWHDAMAGQLRHSVAVCSVNSLPFTGVITPVDDPSAIARSFLVGYHGGLPMSELEEDDESRPKDLEESGVAVWCQAL